MSAWEWHLNVPQPAANQTRIFHVVVKVRRIFSRPSGNTNRRKRLIYSCNVNENGSACKWRPLRTDPQSWNASFTIPEHRKVICSHSVNGKMHSDLERCRIAFSQTYTDHFECFAFTKIRVNFRKIWLRMDLYWNGLWLMLEPRENRYRCFTRRCLWMVILAGFLEYVSLLEMHAERCLTIKHLFQKITDFWSQTFFMLEI